MILMKRLILYLTTAFILAGCGLALPLTPEQRAASNEKYCRDSLISIEEEIDQKTYAKAAKMEAELKELGIDDNLRKDVRQVLWAQARIDKRIAYRACLRDRRFIYGN